MKAKTFIYSVSELERLQQNDYMGILSDYQIGNRMELLKLISCRLSLMDFLSINSSDHASLIANTKLSRDPLGKPSLIFSDSHSYLDSKIHISFSYQGDYLACGLAHE